MAERDAKKPRIGEGDSGSSDRPQDTPEEPLDMLARVRQERSDRLLAAVMESTPASASNAAAADAASSVKNHPPEAEHDLSMKIRLVRALLTANEEIWHRCCQRSAGHRGGRSSAPTKDAKGRAYVTRLIYQHVSVEPTISRYESERRERERADRKDDTPKNNSLFKVKASYQKLLLSEDAVRLPEELASIFPVPIADDGYNDYRRYLELALLLSEEVLSPFLDHLRRHLECPFPNGTSTSRAEFLDSLPRELKTIRDTGEHRESYDVSTEAGRTKLTKFLDYLL